MKYLVSLLVPLTLIALSFHPMQAARSSQQERIDTIGTQAIDDFVTNVGETFIISEVSNSSTGYSWMPEFDEAYLKLQNKKYIRPQKSLSGVPGIEQFNFLALKPGKTTIRMSSGKSGGTTITLSFRVIIKAK